MFELFASIGFVGVLILVVGFVGLFWLAKLVENDSDYEGNDDE